MFKRLLPALVLAACAAVVVSLLFHGKPGPETVQAQGGAMPTPMTPLERANYERLFASLPRVPVPASGGGATVVVVKFTDFQCGGCAWTHVNDRPILQKYQSRYPGAVVMVAKDFPLQMECNVTVKRPFHNAACDAAAAVRMAVPAKRAALEDWLYAHQTELSPSVVRDMAKSLGGVTDFDKGYAAAIQGIRADVELGARLGIGQTPTFFVNGARLPNAPTLPTPEQLDIAIAYELKKAGK